MIEYSDTTEFYRVNNNEKTRKYYEDYYDGEATRINVRGKS